MKKCPGQDKGFWKYEGIFEANYPSCQSQIEFWKDEIEVKCSKCKQIVTNPKLDISCAEWCQYAEECLGLTKVRNGKSLYAKLVEHMKQIYSEDSVRIDRCLDLLNYADQIQDVEGGDPLIVKTATILQDMSNSSTKMQESEDISTAGDILRRYGIKNEQIEQICHIVGSRNQSNAIDSKELVNHG